jgi:predicted alpha/beta superfamily hydrolase
MTGNWEPYVLSGCRARTLRARDGGEYQILLSVPRGTPPPQGFPAIFAVDANAMFGTLVEGMRMSARRSDATGVPPAIAVGIGYPDTDLFDRARRTFDYTFGFPANPAATDDPSLAAGGGAAFLSFLATEVMNLVRSEAPVDASRMAIFGHSLGGLFVLSVLAHKPESFAAYIASSPSIWWNRDDLAQRLSALQPEVVASVSAMICAGEYEQKLAPWQHEAPGSAAIASRRSGRAMVTQARDIAELLRNLGMRSVFHEFEGEDHASVPLLSIAKGLRFALQPRLD